MREALRKALWACSVSVALTSLCAAQAAAKKGQAPDPCQARDRCLRLYRLGKAPNVAALKRAYHAGCDGYSEEAVRALRLYQLGAPGGAKGLLNSMPRGIGDLMSFLWLTSMPGAETAWDITGSYNTVYPKDELVMEGCRNGGRAGNVKLFQSYFAALATESAAHPKYLPGFFAVSQMFGYKAQWEGGYVGQGYTALQIAPMFSRLLAIQLKARPKQFVRFSFWTRYGGPALKQAKASLATEKRKTAPAKPDKGPHMAG